MDECGADIICDIMLCSGMHSELLGSWDECGAQSIRFGMQDMPLSMNVKQNHHAMPCNACGAAIILKVDHEQF